MVSPDLMAPRLRRRAATEKHATRTAPLQPLPLAQLSPFSPQLATSAKTAPRGKEWLHEIKIDGYRIGCRVDRGVATLWSRQGNDWTSTFPEIGAAAARLPVSTALLDGEVAVVLPDGRTSFDALQNLLSGGSRAGLTYFVFDLLHLDGDDVAARPLQERKRRLARLLTREPGDMVLSYTDHVVDDGPKVFAEACKLGLEGIVSKRVDLPYRPGRSLGWLKTKGALRQEFVIGGFTEPEGSRQGIGALLCGTYADGSGLLFAGKVGTGFSERAARELRLRLDPLVQDECPFTPTPDALSRRRAHWVRPSLVAEVTFRAWTHDAKIRHAAFLGLRADKPARLVTRESP